MVDAVHILGLFYVGDTVFDICTFFDTFVLFNFWVGIQNAVQQKQVQEKEVLFLEKNNEVAVQWMVMKTVENVLLEHPTSLAQDFEKWTNMTASVGNVGNVGNGNNGGNNNGGTTGQPTATPQTTPMLSPDHVLMVQYTGWVKRALHLSLLSSMKQIWKIYLRAAHYWLQQEDTHAIVSSMKHRANVLSYDHWLEQLEAWKKKWVGWHASVVGKM